jgi:hypothetical protein
MSAHRPRRIDRDAAERLLRGEPVGAQAGPDALADLLAAAAAPAEGRELAGEQATMAAFRAARPHIVYEPGRRSMVKSTLARVLTVKAIAAAIAISAVGGGVALAAGSGALPTGGGSSHSKASEHATARPSAEAKAEGEHGNAAPSPSLVGLCRAYAAGVQDNPGKALENPAFGALIGAAGGKDKVSDYCTTVLKDEPGGAPTDKGDNAPSAHPTPHATPSHPTGPTAPKASANPRLNPTPPAT